MYSKKQSYLVQLLKKGRDLKVGCEQQIRAVLLEKSNPEDNMESVIGIDSPVS